MKVRLTYEEAEALAEAAVFVLDAGVWSKSENATLIEAMAVLDAAAARYENRHGGVPLPRPESAREPGE